MKKLYVLLVALFCLGINSGKAQYKVLINFDDTNGGNPVTGLVASGNRLFGNTVYGGAYGVGNVYAVNTDGTGFKSLLDFNGTNGINATNPLTLGGRTLFGISYDGGVHNAGIIFRIDTDGSKFMDIHDFDPSSVAYPQCSLTLIGSKLYGSASTGTGNSIGGCVFSIDTNGANYKVLFKFADTNDFYPMGGLTPVGKLLYGMVGYDSTSLIFSIDTDGTGYRILSVVNVAIMQNFSLAYDSGKLYGVTSSGGKNNVGSVFAIDTDGTHYQDLLDFDTINRWSYINSLILHNGLLYGTTTYGGIYDSGCIYSLHTNGTGYTRLYSFDGQTGGHPFGNVIVVGNMLYGTTIYGGTYPYYAGVGVVYQLALCSNTYSQPICIATLDTSTNKNKIIWGRNNSPPANGYGYYNIYKDTGIGYVLLNSQPLNSLSEYIDTSSNWGPVSYQISTVDSCGESALSAPHTTIFLTTTASLNALHLSWTPYGGFTPTQYRIFRGPSLNALKQIDSVANNILTYTDSFPPINSYYAIEAVSPNGVCIPTTHRPNTRLSAMLSGSFSNGFNTATLGISHINTSVSKLNIYPNPSNGNFTLNYSLNAGGNIRTTIVNELGQIVYDNTTQKSGGNITEQLNLGNLASGIYSLRLQTDNSVMVRKLVLMGNR